MDEKQRTAAWCASLALATAMLAAVAGDSLAATHASPAAAQVALMALPASALGGHASGLVLTGESGTVTNAAAAQDSTISVKQFNRATRITGYELHYGSEFDIGPKTSSVDSGVEQYKTAAGAAQGLALHKNDDSDTSVLKDTGTTASISVSSIKVGAHNGYQTSGSIHIPGVPTVYAAEVAFQAGPLLGVVSVTGSSEAASVALAKTLAKKLSARMAGVLAGHIHGTAPVPLNTKPGPAAGQAHLDRAALTNFDLGSGSVTKQGYARPSGALQEYSREFNPAGALADLSERLTLDVSPSAAHTELAILRASTNSKLLAKSLGVRSLSLHEVTVHAGDESTAYRGTTQANGQTIYIAVVETRVGASSELIFAGTTAAAQVTDAKIAHLATIAASRVKHGLS